MKTVNLTSILVLTALLALGAGRAMATPVINPTSTTATSGPYAGDVINSTYTFTNVGTSFTATFTQTQIPNFSSLNPQFELELTGLTYTDSNSFTSSGGPIDLTFTIMGTINMGGQPTSTVTLVAPSFTGTQQGVTFTLQSPVFFPLTNGVSLNQIGASTTGTPGTWTDNVSNLETQPPVTLTGAFITGQQGQQYNLNGTFSNRDGTLEVIYAAPEPNSGWLALLASLGLGGLFLARRGAAKRA